MRVFSWIHENIVLSIIMAMSIGFLIGLWLDTSALRGSVTWLSFFMVYPMMVTLQYHQLLKRGNVKLQVVTQLINFIYLPLMAIVFGLVFFQGRDSFRLGILLIALLPTSGMTVSWTVFAKGNVNEAIRMIVIGLILGGLLAPVYIRLVFQESVDIGFLPIFGQIVLIVFVPMVLGAFTQWGLVKRYGKERFNKDIKKIFPKFSTLSVVVLIGIVMSLRAQMLYRNPELLFIILGPIILGYLMMLFSIHGLGVWLFNREDRIALMNGTMIRSLSLAMAIALTVFSESGPEIALVIAIAYIVQVQLAAFYVKRSVKGLENRL